jgi:transposase
VTCTDADIPVVVELGPGQEADVTRMEELVQASVDRLEVVDEAVADKAYDSDAARGALIDLNICPVIPNKKNRLEPWPFEVETYKMRNRVERCVNKLKQFRRVATRYDKLAVTFRGFVVLACIQIMTR